MPLKQFARLIVLFVLLFICLLFISNSSLVGAGGELPYSPPSPEQPQDPLPADWPDEPGAMPDLIGGKKADRPMVFYQGLTSETPQSVDKATIEVWYGDEQNFGQLGNPQQWVNILGNVSSPYGMKSLSYKLNDDEVKELTIGLPDGPNPRLANTGDLNIEIDYADLNDGDNTVIISAEDYNDELTEKTVIVNYSAGNVWPLPYNTDWGSSANVQDIAQPVDGYWVIQDGKVVPQDIGYDRLLAIGDETWTDYDVVVPVTVDSLDDNGFQGVSNGPAVGMILRWQGHNQTPDPAPPEQPRLDWARSGALGWYRWAEKNGSEGLELRTKNHWIGASSNKVWEFGVPYFIRMSVQSDPGSSGGRAYYRLKIWKQADSEPLSWDLEGWSDEEAMQAGSMALIAHQVDVEIGNVQIKKLSDLTFDLTTNVTGKGKIITDPPGQTQFAYGERVALYPEADFGNTFVGWTGDYNGDDNPLIFYVTKNTTVTANFIEAQPGSLTVEIEGEGTVSKYPDKTTYDGGEIVTLMATPKPGYKLLGWSDDLNTTQNPATIQISGDKSVKATFIPADELAPVSDNFDRCELDTDLWTVVDPAGGGSVEATGTAVQLTVPAGATHTLWNGNMDALRIMQNAQDQDFTLEIKFDTIPSQQVQIEGIMVEQDSDNYMRFDFFYHLGQATMFIGKTVNGVSTPVAFTSFDPGAASAIYMRVNRSGTTWTQSYSFDGTSWQPPQSTGHSIVVNKVGVFAGNEVGASAPEFATIVDYFRNLSYPNSEGYTITIDKIGHGVVHTIPDSEWYLCGQEVQFEAVPDSGWYFYGWSGDFNDNINPLVLYITQDISLEALFLEDFGHILVDKVTNPANDPKAFDFNISGKIDSVDVAFVLADSDDLWDSGDLKPGTYHLIESVHSGWTQESAICDDGSDPANIQLDPGETVTCTFSNRRVAPPKADFSASPYSGVPPLTVDFTSLSSGDFNQCFWSFGDGRTSTTCGNPTLTYVEEGQFSVSLTVKGPGGEDTKEAVKLIEVAYYRQFLPGLMAQN